MRPSAQALDRPRDRGNSNPFALERKRWVQLVARKHAHLCDATPARSEGQPRSIGWPSDDADVNLAIRRGLGPARGRLPE